MRIAIVVLSYFDNDVYSELYKIQNETWNSIVVEDVDTYFLIGNCENNIIENNIIKTTFPENIVCGEKVLKGFELIKSLNYDFIFRTNSSSYIDKESLKNFIKQNGYDGSYCGVVGNFFGTLFASGSGFLLSKKNLDLIVENSNLWDFTHMDDVGLGALMAKLNVHPQEGFRQDILIDNYVLDPNQYHYRIKCGCDNRVSFEKHWFYDVHAMKVKKVYKKNTKVLTEIKKALSL